MSASRVLPASPSEVRLPARPDGVAQRRQQLFGVLLLAVDIEQSLVGFHWRPRLVLREQLQVGRLGFVQLADVEIALSQEICQRQVVGIRGVGFFQPVEQLWLLAERRQRVGKQMIGSGPLAGEVLVEIRLQLGQHCAGWRCLTSTRARL